MKTSAWKFILLPLLALALAMPMSAGAAEKLRYGCVQNIDHVYNVGAKKLAELTAKGTNNEIKVSIYPDSRLGQQLRHAGPGQKRHDGHGPVPPGHPGQLRQADKHPEPLLPFQ